MTTFSWFKYLDDVSQSAHFLFITHNIKGPVCKIYEDLLAVKAEIECLFAFFCVKPPGNKKCCFP